MARISVIEPRMTTYTLPEQRLFDIPQAAAYLGRTPGAVSQLIKRGQIKVTKIDSKIQLDRIILDKLIEDSTFKVV